MKTKNNNLIRVHSRPFAVQSAFTLIEMLVVVSIMVLFASLAIPAFNNITQSNKTGQALSLIKSYMALAQAHAAQTQKYAGVRFQFDRDGWRIGKQYLALIELNETGDYFYAVQNSKPTALPLGVAVISGMFNADQYIDDHTTHHTDPTTLGGMNDATTFSIIFSPTGQMVIKNITCCADLSLTYNSVFGGENTVNSDPIPPAPPHPLLYHDVHWGSFVFGPSWCYTESSATGFYVCEVGRLINVSDPTQRSTEYVGHLQPSIVNTFTGSVLQLDDIR